MAEEGASGKAQDLANQVTDSAQGLVNEVYNLGEDAAREVLDAVISANEALGKVLSALRDKLVGSE